MTIENLKKRIQRLEARSLRKAIILRDGTAWIPKISSIEMLISLMEAEEQPEALSPEVRADAAKWAEYEPKPGEPALHGLAAIMSREIVPK